MPGDGGAFAVEADGIEVRYLGETAGVYHLRRGSYPFVATAD